MAFFAHPSGVRLPYFQSLDYKPGRLPETPVSCSASPLTSSNHGHSAIDVNRLPGHVSRLVGGEIDRRGGDIFRGPQPRGRDLGKNRFTLLVVERVRHGRLDEAWRDAIGGHVPLGIFGAERLDQADDPRL